MISTPAAKPRVESALLRRFRRLSVRSVGGFRRLSSLRSLRRLSGLLAVAVLTPAVPVLAIAVISVALAAGATAMPTSTVTATGPRPAVVAPAPTSAPPLPAPSTPTTDPVYETPDHEQLEKSAPGHADPEGSDAFDVPTQCFEDHPQYSRIPVAIDVRTRMDEPEVLLVSFGCRHALAREESRSPS
jgi:hypothetical protein